MAGTDNLEVEWQFDAPDLAAVTSWLESARVPGYLLASAGSKQLDDTYFDTDDWRIHRAGYTCRVRRKASGPELTLKSIADAVAALRSRVELNEPLEPVEPIEPAAAPGQCGQLLRLICGKRPISPIFTVRTDRRLFNLADELGPLGEIAVDDTIIPVGEQPPARLSRIEVEVGSAAVERARRFVNVLVATAHLVPATTSKFEAALNATGQSVSHIAHGLGPSTISAEMTAGKVGYAILRKQFATFLANEPGTRLGEDIEALHDMRVATRRMRAAMSAFAPYLPPRMAFYRQELGWLAAALGEVRDLDVQLERMDEWRSGFSESQATVLDSVEALLHLRRNRARARMLTALNSRHYDHFVERFAAFLGRGIPRTFAPGSLPILGVAPGLVEKRYRRVRKLGDAINPGSPPEHYHALRIDAKKLRYAIEFVGPIYGKPATDFSARVTAMQDVLGLHQDAYVAMDQLEDMAHASARRLGPAALLVMGAIAERYRIQAEDLRKQFPRVYRPIAGAEWRRLRRLMDGRA
ncbi:MAG: CHAD domain-containing protein [Dehalococcoidia bacterium]|nr:CHAD domain-containing protein [Dehalococcoidia bacterium]